ncbi:DUF4365 domain-containing protein [Streptosporangium lutulentum]|uniref:DUF4365 domain-containing protein n=1 Tax=Streptosporangium lutulentum TaxID=1461250 RepID=A0ABT9QPL1_9ACTN|nr:DUF4365 domain-containing protein [Streptosporangium lutulentum]MDP9848695.1 hypothetical protein [Streptosporangium lutulentum]
MVSAREQEQNTLQGDFGEAWLEVVAAGCGLLHGRPATLDLQKADVQLFSRGIENGTYNPAVLIQVKTTVDLRRQANGDYSYDVDIETYDVLRRDDHSIRRILAVIGVSKDGENVRLHADGTLLVGRGAWVSLEGLPASGNAKTQVVRLPGANTLDSPGLRLMLRTYGVRRSTPVPDVDAWGLS